MTTKTGILLVNLGTPAAPTTAAVKAFLSQFLHDQRVVDLPRYLWCPCFISSSLPTRSPKVAKLYQQVWTEQGSPDGHQPAAARGPGARAQAGRVEVPVALAMTYGAPSLADGWQALKAQGVNRVILLPLYPQYSVSTTASVFDAWARAMKPSAICRWCGSSAITMPTRSTSRRWP